MSLIFFAHSMFGNLIVIRILRSFRARAMICPLHLMRIGITFAFMAAAAAIHSLFAVAIVAISLGLALSWIESRKFDQLVRELPIFLDRWLLNLRTGAAFTASRDLALKSMDPRFQALLAPWLQPAPPHRARRHPVFGVAVADELARIQSLPHQAVLRIENLRDSLRRASDFRRKSGLAMRQTAVQSAVLLALHLALTIFTGFRHGWGANSDLITISTCMTGAGLALLCHMARRIKWSI